jgi:chemotaxis protein MotB
MAKKHKHEEHENLERWLVSYADFITLLFAFFTVLYATSQKDSAKYKQVAESISKSFLSSGGIFPLKSHPFVPFEKSPEKGTPTPVSPDDAGKNPKDEQAALERVREKIESIFEKATGLSVKHGDVEVYRTETGFKIRLAENILYRPGSDKLRKENVPFIYEVGKHLATLGLPIQIEGHTDNREPASGMNNWQLSLSRSYNIVRFLVEGSQFPKSKLSAAGFGDASPISDNDTIEGRRKNRRVEISVITGDSKISDLLW